MNLKEGSIQHKFLYRSTRILWEQRAQPCTIVVTLAKGLEDYLGVCQGSGLEPIPVYAEHLLRENEKLSLARQNLVLVHGTGVRQGQRGMLALAGK